jgi:hypothetical protein
MLVQRRERLPMNDIAFQQFVLDRGSRRIWNVDYGTAACCNAIAEIALVTDTTGMMFMKW